ncbi:TPR Domain containing protein [Tritrichomonas foetus]|uniref:TPR Domain containing protein n=1 Tax=Tritrichomonas foetus TaxID=1144522 RepID=A0A1J4K8P7_9EUKA|nr:TPR Domain containing protein [Tritrichomonas foetus]|eukprot:OHT07587.1 TPR Domain containing protein [Tritrichomonas foetus]
MFDLTGLPPQCSDVFRDPVQYFNSLKADDLKTIFQSEPDNSTAESAISLGMTALLCFVIENFTGPSIKDSLSKNVIDYLHNSIPENFQIDLNLNGETISHLAVLPEFIWLSFTLFRKFNAPPVWISRATAVLQRCLSGPSEILQSIIMPGFTGIELAMAYRQYHQYTMFLNELENYRKSIQFEFELIGKLGKKTKFQQESKAQLTLTVQNSAHIRENTVQANAVSDQLNDREIRLEDDSHLLERPHLDENNEIPPLTDEELCFLLLECHAIGDRAVSETKDEKRIPLLQTILQCKPAYSIATCALFNKSLLEKKDLYTQQRAAIQLDSIVADFAKEEPKPSDRLKCFFMLDHPPLWEVRREMGMQLMMVGAARSAANVFIEHKMWDELAMCCQVAKDSQLALDVLEKEKKTPLILCIIGEFKSDKEMLNQAWEESNHSFSRAQRSMARIYLHAAQWSEAAECYRKALALNRLYPDCWFSLGCSLMNLNDFESAVDAFQNVVSQKNDDSESFSNLAICLQQLKKFPEAHKAITQAVRFDRRSIKLWENYMIISMNNNCLNDCLLGIEEVQKANNKWCNTPLLYDILHEVVENKGDLQRFVNDMDLIAQNADCGFDFWTIFADLCEALGNNERALEMRNTVIKLLEKDGKVREVVEFRRIVEAAEKLVQTTKKVIEKKRGTVQRIRVLVKKYSDDFSSLEEFATLQGLQSAFD